MPLTLALVLVVAVIQKLLPSDVDDVVRAVVLLASNIILALLALELIRRYARRRRIDDELAPLSRQVGETEPVTVAGQ